MHIRIPHKTTQALALQKIKGALHDAKPQLAAHATITAERWEDRTLHFGVNVQGKEINGTLEITDTDFVIDATLPLIWRLFEGRIAGIIEEKARELY